MTPFSPSAIRTDTICSAYERTFSATRLEVLFHIAEIVTIVPESAFARKNSAGTCLAHATGAVTAEQNSRTSCYAMPEVLEGRALQLLDHDFRWRRCARS